MGGTWNLKRLLTAVIVTVIAMFLVVAVSPVLAGQPEPVMTDDDATELIAADLSAAEDKKPGLDVAVAAEPERLSASPGAAYATTGEPFHASQKLPSGGAAGLLASTGKPVLHTS